MYAIIYSTEFTWLFSLDTMAYFSGAVGTKGIGEGQPHPPYCGRNKNKAFTRDLGLPKLRYTEKAEMI